MHRARLFAAAYVLLAALVAPAVLFAAEDGDVQQPPAQQQAAPPAGQPPAQTPEPSAPEQPAAEPQVKPADEEPAADDESTPPARASAGSVTIKDFLFAPKSVTVSVGDRVTWSNSGPSAHSATASNGSFDTGLLKKGESGSHKFTNAGTFAYYCRPHPFMKATIKVVAASSGGGGSSGGGNSGGGGSSSSGTSGTSGTADQNATSSGSSSGSGLPATGLETGILAALGAALLGLGVLLRRRSA